MTYPIKIVGCVVDVHNLTLYKADGDTIVIPQGDSRIRDLVAKLVPAFEASGPQFYLLQAEDMSDRNHFADAEQKMGGVVRFFKMVKSKAKELLDRFVEPIAPLELGTKKEEPVHILDGQAVVAAFVPEVKLPPEAERPLTKSASAVAEIMANAIPSSSPNFAVVTAAGEEETTVLAVLEDNTVIPGVEQLALQAQSVSESSGTGIGMQNFLRRASMIRRGHSVEDLLKFIQKGELPLADDGCVLVYKLLNELPGEEGTFVDVHSGNVKQRVGSFVHMDEKLVDADRRQDCSNGLHVARRDYLRTFSGNVCVLAKLAPEDVIAVPQYDARKLRAKGYHIIAVLTEKDRDLVKSNQPMQDQVLLGNAVAGNHVGILEYVQITQSKGGGLVVTPAEKADVAPALNTELSAKSLDHLDNPETNPEANKVDARALALEVVKDDLRAEPAPRYMHEDLPAEPLSETLQRSETGQFSHAPPAPVERAVSQLAALRANWAKAETAETKFAAVSALFAYKRSVRKSWAGMGFTAAEVDQLTTDYNLEAAAASLPKALPFPILGGDNSDLPTKPAKVKKAAPPLKPPVVKTKDKPVAKATKAKVKPVETQKDKPAVAHVPGKLTQQEQMAKLVEIYNRNPDKQNAKEIFNFKSKTKKSWEVLGVPDKAFQKKITERAKL